ncbi:MAG: GGDEF domain-containing protein [Desulfobacula sp.]|jgi:diguanylate cyclase (GGDEF)-like protein|uniref:GGDEF domain-containing protein n=1 Tax=Desulfobacula sp. TaxID=2593537 RepID=UPI001DBAE9E8|nr:GGDEF domain-containing protein [Desulfobacula sp.]MBT5539765.1 GGDEF domain-containing protein [Candidatus Neomarinimicrobiota bacterium]MBT3487494.1 GGDEF domain-containing protein [Desulfobacula sp.]MBT3806917.1 GGDEF domain-containing protein [Desulfobacula sp.]MBT4027180.1 GGDEF domain-containing protein [Desulfobacula sp.]
MTELTDKEWISRLSKIDFSYQPIVNIHTGNAFGFEALLRNHRTAGFCSIANVFDQAYHQGILHQVDLFLRRKAFKKFAEFKGNDHIKLFYNLDNRLFDTNDYSQGNTAEMLGKYGYSLDDICFEISEKHQFSCHMQVLKVLDTYRKQGYKIAVDDCGAGFSGLQLLYHTEPDYIKIDRFFIQNLENDPKKRLVVSTIVNMAHFMGSLVIAEGVEAIDEYLLCKEIGCDMIQGYFVQKPQINLGRLKKRYPSIEQISKNDRRNGAHKDRSLISNQISYIQPVYSDCSITRLFDQFREGGESNYYPVINQYDEPVGVIRESAFKEYIFSKFGRQLLENPSLGKDISRFVKKIPIADIHSSVEKLIETYTQFNNNEGLIMVENMKYIGILSTNSLLRIINEKNLTLARNQNPLTKLPGNTMIHEYFSKSLSDFSSVYHLIYFDFDNFKPFNDTYGFRNGDRLILMFADLLKKMGLYKVRFVGHIGGDDFFLGVKNSESNKISDEMNRLANQFKENAESFYDPKTVEQGFLVAKNRDGQTKQMPLMSISVAILELPKVTLRNCSIEKAANIIAGLKKEAKHSRTGIVFANIMEILDPGSIQLLEQNTKEVSQKPMTDNLVEFKIT